MNTKKEVMDKLRELFERYTGIEISRRLRDMHTFNDDGDLIIPLTRDYGVVLWPLDFVNDLKDIRERYTNSVGEKGLTMEGRVETRFLLSGEYKKYVVEIKGKRYVPWYFVTLNYRRGRLEGFMGVFYKKIISIYGMKYR